MEKDSIQKDPNSIKQIEERLLVINSAGAAAFEELEHGQRRAIYGARNERYVD